MDMEQKEFTVFGKSIEKLSLIYGMFLILWGVAISFISGSTSATSYIPSFLGAPIVIFSVLSLYFPSKKKIFMHIVVLVGVTILLGGLDLLRGLINGNLFENFWADLSKLMMLLSGCYFVYLCVLSFIFARKNKDQLN